MSYSTDLIDAVKEAENCSDYKVSQLLGVSRQLISHIRVERRHLTPELTTKAAKLAGIDPRIALLRRYRETIEDLETRHYIEEIELDYQRLKDAS